jgi:hypothetical protein
VSDTRMFRIIICPLAKFLRRQIRYIEKITVLTSHTVMCEYEASHYLDVVLTGFAVVVMFDYVLRLWPVVRHTVIHCHCYLHYVIH